MSSSGYPYIARPGWTLIALLLIVTAGLYHYGGWHFSVPPALLLLFLFYLFRDPHREIPALPLAILCPVDGRIISVSEEHDPYLQRRSRCITLKVSRFGSYAVRSPTEGNVVERWFLENIGKGKPGYGVQLRTDEDDDIMLELGRNRFWQSLMCYMQPGERVGQGQRCGYLRFGATVRVYVPDSSRVEVRNGDRVQSGTTVLATLIH